MLLMSLSLYLYILYTLSLITNYIHIHLYLLLFVPYRKIITYEYNKHCIINGWKSKGRKNVRPFVSSLSLMRSCDFHCLANLSGLVMSAFFEVSIATVVSRQVLTLRVINSNRGLSLTHWLSLDCHEFILSGGG